MNAPDKNGWLPIETAPKDGTPILGYQPPDLDYAGDCPLVEVVAWHVLRWNEPDYEWGWREVFGERYASYDITLWKPIVLPGSAGPNEPALLKAYVHDDWPEDKVPAA